MSIKFDWDDNKAESNEKKHGITFQEAGTAFFDTLSLTISDPLHSEGEERLVLIGSSDKNRLLIVVHTDRGDTIRIISARKATVREKRIYGKHYGCTA